MVRFNASQLFASSPVTTLVVCGTPRFVIPTPLDASEPLVEPESYVDKGGKEHVKGSPLTYWDSATNSSQPYPEGKVGLRFWNDAEKKWQGCPVVDGNGNRTVVLLNHVTEDHREGLEEVMAEEAVTPFDLTTRGFRQFEKYARGLGLGNFYDSDVSYVRSAMSRDGNDVTEGEEYGFLARKRDVKPSLYVPGPCEVDCIGAAGLQPFGEEGGVIVQMNASTINPNQVQDAKKQYTLQDGTKLTNPARQIAHAVLPTEEVS